MLVAPIINKSNAHVYTLLLAAGEKRVTKNGGIYGKGGGGEKATFELPLSHEEIKYILQFTLFN